MLLPFSFRSLAAAAVPTLLALALTAPVCAEALLPTGSQAPPQPVPARVTAINDRDYAPAVMRLIEAAEHTIDINLYQASFYEDYPGSASNDLIDALVAAAGRGVLVTAVIDRSSFKPPHDDQNLDVARRLAEAGAAVFIDPDEIQSHQKLIILDREATVVASLNWTHYSLSSNREVAVILWGSAIARQYEAYMAQRIADAAPYVLPNAAAKPQEPLAEALGLRSYAADKVIPADNRWYFPTVAQAIREAQTNIDLVQVYAHWYDLPPEQLPGRPEGKPPETNLLAQDLVAAAKRGVKVRVLLDNTWTEDRQFAWSTSKIAMAKYLQENGIEVYLDDPKESIHAKMAVIDDKTVLVGSSNWSFHALEMNNEANVLVTAPEMVAKVYRPWLNELLSRAVPFSNDLPAIVGGGNSRTERDE